MVTGKSNDRERAFPVDWDRCPLPNGRYEIVGLTQIFTLEGLGEKIIAQPNIVEVVVKN